MISHHSQRDHRLCVGAEPAHQRGVGQVKRRQHLEEERLVVGGRVEHSESGLINSGDSMDFSLAGVNPVAAALGP